MNKHRRLGLEANLTLLDKQSITKKKHMSVCGSHQSFYFIKIYIKKSKYIQIYTYIYIYILYVCVLNIFTIFKYVFIYLN